MLEDVRAIALQVVGHVDFLTAVVAPQLIPLLELGMCIRLRAGDRELIRQMLIDGDADLGISAYATTDEQLRCELIHT